MQKQSARETGFVLKRFFPKQKKISILTSSMGKILLVVKNDKSCQLLWPGMLVSFESLEWRSLYVTHRVEIIRENSYRRQYDIYWLHHLLELFYYFVPYADPAYRLFDQLAWYLDYLHSEIVDDKNEIFFRQFCIVHFLSSMGSYHVPKELRYLLSLFVARDASLNDIIKKNSNSHVYNVSKINRWVISCLRKHPCFRSFKTVSFVYPIQTMMEL